MGSSTPTTRLESRGQSVPCSLARRCPCEETSIRPTGLLLNCNRRQSPPRAVRGWPPRRRSAQHRQTAVREPQSAAQPFCRSPDRQRSNTPSKEPEMWTGPLRRTVLQLFRPSTPTPSSHSKDWPRLLTCGVLALLAEQPIQAVLSLRIRQHIERSNRLIALHGRPGNVHGRDNAVSIQNEEPINTTIDLAH